MFRVTKEEAEFIRKHAKNARIAMTGKKKSSRAKKWYVDESRESLRLLERFRKGKTIHAYK